VRAKLDCELLERFNLILEPDESGDELEAARCTLCYGILKLHKNQLFHHNLKRHLENCNQKVPKELDDTLKARVEAAVIAAKACRSGVSEE